MDIKSLYKTHPELFDINGEYREKLQLKTLTELGFKSVEEAQSHNYTRVKPNRTFSLQIWPSLWLSNEDIPIIQELVKRIDKQRNEKYLIELSIIEAQNIRQSEFNIKQGINKIIEICGLPYKTIEEALSTEFKKDLCISPENAVKRFVTISAPKWHNQSPDASNMHYNVDGFKVSAISEKLLRYLILGETSSYTHDLEVQLIDLRKRSDEIYDFWIQTKPDWFSEDELRLWSNQAVNGTHASHPLLSIPEIRKLQTKPVKVIAFGKTVSALLKINGVANRLWKLPNIVENSITSQLNILLPRLLEGKVQASFEEFASMNPFDKEWKEIEYSTEEWNEVLTNAYSQVIGENFVSERVILLANAEVSKMLARRRHVLAVKLCRNELPKHLKDFYPQARSIDRKLTFIYGPTNSGKTHHALSALRNAKSGAYLGPLRLLALEVFDRLNAAETATSLVTGELVQEIPGACHVSATIEMMDFGRIIDLAVIDEVQMIGDRERGAAWLSAILGAPARHVILLGSKNALSSMRMLANLTNEPLEEIELTRLNELNISDQPINLKYAPPGCALIVFSRQSVLSLANHMRTNYGRKVSVLYGALSPEVRAEQARLFRNNETDCLITTDCVSMGMNLPISTIIFTTTTKWNGKHDAKLTQSLTCQIAGRAGRYGLYESGVVTATYEDDLNYIRKMLEKPISELEPPFNTGLNIVMVESISKHLNTNSISQIISFFQEYMTLEEWTIPSSSRDQLILAVYLDRFELDIRQKFILSNAPALKKGSIISLFVLIVKCVGDNECESFNAFDIETSHMNLQALEEKVSSITLYSWMHYRFPTLFPRIKEATELLSELNKRITLTLPTVSGRQCRKCVNPIPWDHSFGICDDCFDARRYRHNDLEYGADRGISSH